MLVAAYVVDTEDGQYFIEPDQTTIGDLITGLGPSNSFLVVLPDTDAPTWHASVARQGAGYLVEQRDENGRDTKTAATDPTQIATDLIAWLQQRP